MSGIVPLRRSAIRRPLPSTGSQRVGSPASSVLVGRSDFLPPIPPHFVAFAWQYRFSRLCFAPVGGQALPPQARGFGSPGCPSGRLPRGDGRISQVPGEPPLCSCPALRPRWDLGVRPFFRRFGSAFRQLLRRRLPRDHFRGSITQPVHSLSSLGHRSYLQPPKTRFRLLAKLCRAGLLTRWGSFARFLSLLHLILPAQACPGAQ